MIDPALPNDLFAELRDLKRRLSDLERRRTPFSGTNEGGFIITNAGGVEVFKVTSDGMIRPALNLAYNAVQSPVIITAAAFTSAWETSPGSLTHPAVRWQCQVGVDAATTATVRLGSSGGGTEYTSTVALAAGTLTTVTFNWTPTNWPLGIAGGRRLLQFQARRDTGAGNVNVYAPQALYMGTAADLGATPTGL